MSDILLSMLTLKTRHHLCNFTLTHVDTFYRFNSISTWTLTTLTSHDNGVMVALSHNRVAAPATKLIEQYLRKQNLHMHHKAREFDDL